MWASEFVALFIVSEWLVLTRQNDMFVISWVIFVNNTIIMSLLNGPDWHKTVSSSLLWIILISWAVASWVLNNKQTTTSSSNGNITSLFSWEYIFFVDSNLPVEFVLLITKMLYIIIKIVISKLKLNKVFLSWSINSQIEIFVFWYRVFYIIHFIFLLIIIDIWLINWYITNNTIQRTLLLIWSIPLK